MALSDGAHASLEDFSYFTLLHQPDFGEDVEISEKTKEGEAAKPREGASTLFGVSCTRQIRSDRLRVRSKSVTRSSVQKSVVVVINGVAGLGELRMRLGMVTEMWFGMPLCRCHQTMCANFRAAQEDFTDTTILKEFQESLVRASAQGSPGEDFFGLSLREVIHEFRHQTLVLVKCLLLQRKMLFFSSKCERLCLLQFALLSLLPGLTSHLENAAHPELEQVGNADPTAKRTARAELLESFGQPLPIFSKGAFFSPYTPLQHLDMLAAYSTKSYVVGSTNSLLLQQQSRYADIMVNLDTEPYSITIFSPSLKQEATLSAADRRWIDNLMQQVLDTWDPNNPSRPKNMGYAGSEEMIRLQFEEYILSLCSSMAYQVYRERTDGTVKDIFWKDDGQETGVVSTTDEKEAPELRQQPAPITASEKQSLPDTEPSAHEKAPRPDSLPPPKPPRPTSTTSTTNPHEPSSHTQPLPRTIHNRTSSLDTHLPPADLASNALDFRPEFLSAWRHTRNFELFIASLTSTTFPGSPTFPTSHTHQSSTANPTAPSALAPTTAAARPRIFDLIPPAHPTGGGLNIDDVSRRLAQNISEFRTAYKVDERYKETRENVGRALEAGREKWGRWWAELEERRRREGGGGEDVAPGSSAGNVGASPSAAVAGGVVGSAATSTTTSGGGSGAAAAAGGGGGSAAWTTALRERAAKVQLQKPDTTHLQSAAKENAAKAGAYLSSWGSWAREKSAGWQQQQQQGGQQQRKGAAGGNVAEVVPVDVTLAARGTAEGSPAGLAAEGQEVKAKRASVGKFKEDID